MKAVKVILIVVGIFIILAVAGSAMNTKEAVNNTNPTSNSAQTTPEPAPAPKEKMTIKNTTFKPGSTLNEVVGEITNNDTVQHTATIKATFYDANNKILGTASGSVNEVAPSQTKTFNLITMDKVEGYKEMKVEVDTLL